ncbi:MAG: prepilin-type N-terminal cleavage/methylation domain-containing protein [Elusimicrobia bacterium]|nr:prepilin-type N-terminal cleavage/methylation domain-containing protein [Elusimicrobiota bacterium]
MKKQIKGFTLVELIIVIVIVAILSIVSVPIYQGYTERARFTEAISVLRAIADANTLYFLENGTWCTDIRELPVQLEGELIKIDNYWRIQHNNFIYSCVGDSNYDTIATVNRAPYHERYWISLRAVTGRYGDQPKLGDYGLDGDVYSSSQHKTFDKNVVDYYKKKFPRRS